MITGRFCFMGNGFTPVELIAVLTVAQILLAIAAVFFIGYMKSHKVDEAVGIMSCIIVSQEIEKAGRRLEYYEAGAVGKLGVGNSPSFSP